MPFVIPAPRAVGPTTANVRTFTLTGPSGQAVTLHGSPRQTTMGAPQGLDAPPLDTFSTELPTTGGVWLGSRVTSRPVLLPVTAWADTPEEWEQTRRDLVDMFLTPGEHTLLCRALDGATRELRLRYRGGMTAPAALDTPLSSQWAIEMTAYDPYWYGPVRSRSWVEAASVGDFFPGPPFVLAPANIIGTTSVTNNGAVEVWPEWRIDGPITSASFTGPEGDVFKYDASLSAGEWVTIKTDPRTLLSQKVVDDSGANVWGNITGASDPFAVFWPLPRGESTITLAAAGSSTTTAITVSWREAFRTW